MAAKPVKKTTGAKPKGKMPMKGTCANCGSMSHATAACKKK